MDEGEVRENEEVTKMKIKIKEAFIHLGYCRYADRPCEQCEYYDSDEKRCTAPIEPCAIEFITEDGKFLLIPLPRVWTTNII